MIIYLAGNIPKGDDETKSFEDWRGRYQEILGKIFQAEFITPKAGEVDETDALLVVGKDSRSIKISDLVVVNCEDRLGAGTAMELVIAKYLKKPVVTVIPKDTYHRRSNLQFNGVLVQDWAHPFVKAFSDFVLDKVEDVAEIKELIFSTKIKDISLIDEAIALREKKLS